MRAKAKRLAKTASSVFIEFGKFEKLYGLDVKTASGWLDKFGEASRRKDGVVTREDFQEYLGLGANLGAEVRVFGFGFWGFGLGFDSVDFGFRVLVFGVRSWVVGFEFGFCNTSAMKGRIYDKRRLPGVSGAERT
jgi:hypothetical protein